MKVQKCIFALSSSKCMFVCISKGNEVLKDIVAVELQGFVWLLIYHFMFLNVSSLQPHSHSSVCIYFYWTIFHSICCYQASGPCSLQKKPAFYVFSVYPDKENQWFCLDWKETSGVPIIIKMTWRLVVFICKTACSPHITHLWERAEWFNCIIKVELFLSLFDVVFHTGDCSTQDGWLY